MNSKKFILKHTAGMLIGQLICSAVVVGVYALLDLLDMPVLLGAVFGVLLSTGNFFFMAIGADMAADKAVEGNVKGGTAVGRASSLLRLVVLCVLLFALAKSGLCNIVPMVLPLAFIRPILMLQAYFEKPGDKKK